MTYQTLLEALIRNGKIDGITAKRVADFYCKQKIVKYDAHGGYRLIHGGFFNRQTIRRAAEMTSK